MSKKTIYLLILIILIGAFFRFYNLDRESFWLDEGTTSLTVIKYDALGILKNVKESGQTIPEYYPQYDEDLPLYYMVLRGWIDLFGTSEFAFRSFSALFGISSLVAVFYLARYLFNDKIALLAIFLSAINLTLIWYSQEARQYSDLLFLSLVSIIFLLKAIKEEKIKYIIGLLVVNAFIIYSHFPWIIFIAFEALYASYIIYFDYTKKNVIHKKIIVALIIIGVLYLPIIGRAIYSETNTVRLYGKPDIGKIAQFGVQLSTWLYPSVEMRQKIYDAKFSFSLYEWALLASVLLTAAITALFFLIGIKKSFERKESLISLLFMFFAPVLLSLTLSWLHPYITIFQLKQMIYIIPAFLILVSVGAIRMRFMMPFIIVIIVLSILPIHAYYANIDKQQFREAVAFLPKDEPILININSAQVAFKYYYGEKENAIGIKDVEELKSKIKNMDSFWVLLTFTKYSDPKDSIKKYLDDNYELIEEKNDFFDIKLLHYKKIKRLN